jgi:hypothetical protein
MKLNKNLAMILLAVYLIVVGLQGLGMTFNYLPIIAALCALAAGILLLINR